MDWSKNPITGLEAHNKTLTSGGYTPSQTYPYIPFMQKYKNGNKHKPFN